MTIHDNRDITYIVENEDTITSSYFKTLISNPFLTLEGAYITYQISNTVIYKGIDTPENEVASPELNNFYFNTATKEEFRYDGASWISLPSPMLDVLVETGFSAAWVPVTTVEREKGIELLLPKEYLPINSDQSINLFVGFKDMVDSSNIISALGIPLVSSLNERIIDREDNTSIYIPIKFTCGFIPTILETPIQKLEGENLHFRNNPEVWDIATLLADYKSYSSSDSSYGAGDLMGTSLNI